MWHHGDQSLPLHWGISISNYTNKTGCELLGLHGRAAETSNLLGRETVPHPKE
jgi:hypothetical protein